MLERNVGSFIEKQIKAGVIKPEEKALYIYGYILAMETLLNILVGVLIGVGLKSLDTVIVFWLLYIPLRSFSGGWHAKKGWQCLIFSNAILFPVIMLDKYMVFESNKILFVLLGLIEAVAITILSPVDSGNKRITPNEKIMYKNKSAVIIVIECSCSVFIYRIRGIMIIAYSILLISLIVQVVLNHNEIRYSADFKR